MTEFCACGKPLHYSDAGAEFIVRQLVAELGPTQPVTTPRGTWRVPRHYVALHGLSSDALPYLAARFGWEQM